MSKARVKNFYNPEEFLQHLQEHPEANGFSPGGAASFLGVSRQRVHQMIAQGHFRTCYLYDRSFDRLVNKASVILISKEDLQAYKASARKPGGRPKKVA